MKRKTIMFLTMIFTVVFSAIASSYIVNADELDGYTKVDWSWIRDMETTDVNSVIVGGNIPFWRYVNAENPENNAIWKSIYGDELSDGDVTKIWLGDIDKRYVVASVDVVNIPDENIRQYIYDHIDEDLPDLKFKFDIDADVEGDDNDKKASKLFNGDIGYRVYRDGDTCRIEIKFSPKFLLAVIPYFFIKNFVSSNKFINLPSYEIIQYNLFFVNKLVQPLFDILCNLFQMIQFVAIIF